MAVIYAWVTSHYSKCSNGTSLSSPVVASDFGYTTTKVAISTEKGAWSFFVVIRFRVLSTNFIGLFELINNSVFWYWYGAIVDSLSFRREDIVLNFFYEKSSV